MTIKAQTLLIAGGILAGALVIAYVARKGITGAAADAVGAVADAGAGVVLGVGDVLGVPRTEVTRCEAAKAAGNLWEVSLYCPASDYLAEVPKALGRLF